MKNKSCGFTLLEMLVVITILGIMATTTFGGTVAIEKYQFKALSEEVAELIQTAQQMATLKNESYSVKVKDQGGRRTVDVTYGGGVEKRVEIPQDVTISISTQEKEIQFEQDMSPTKAGTLCMKHKKLKEEIHITVLVATGKVTIYEGKKC